jgi:hypothetical protein
MVFMDSIMTPTTDMVVPKTTIEVVTNSVAAVVLVPLS